MSEELKFLINAVKGASELITDEFIVNSKGDKGDLVTNFDYEIEKYLIDKIKEEYPDFDIVSEEFNSKKELSDNCFTIDPIDGTINFANNIPLWGIQVACIKNGKPCASVIYLPKLDEFYYADENGAFMNGEPIKVNDLNEKSGIYAVEGRSKMQNLTKFDKVSMHSRIFFSSAVNFAWVAAGKLSATNFMMDTPWDYIPGQYLVEKAGGVIFNNDKIHVATNNEKVLKLIKEISISSNDEVK